MIENMKKQFSQLLYDIGFLTSSQVKDRQANHYSSKKLQNNIFLIVLFFFLDHFGVFVRNFIVPVIFHYTHNSQTSHIFEMFNYTDNMKLVKAVICAGLYPHVVKVSPRNGFKYVHIFTMFYLFSQALFKPPQF